MFTRTGHDETVVLLRRENAIHNMNLDSEPYEMIKSGEKTIELRLFDEKRRKIQVGDTIVFTNRADGQTIRVTVEKIHRFDNFEELYKSLPLLRCGYTEETVKNASAADMEKYYSIDEQKKCGVIGIEVKRFI